MTPSSKRPASQRSEHGFTLVEMAIVLLIMGLLLGGGLTVLSAQIDQQKVKETQQLLNDARESLIGFATNGNNGVPHLPCPDSAGNDGLEDRAPGGACSATQGNLPWVTLGLQPDTDAWGNRLRYVVTPAFAHGSTGMTLTSAGTLTVNNAGGTALATAIPAVLISHGKNGRGATNGAGGTNLAPTGANEITNANPTTTLVSHAPVGAGGVGGEFDDQLIWLTPHILFNRLVQAGRLP